MVPLHLADFIILFQNQIQVILDHNHFFEWIDILDIFEGYFNFILPRYVYHHSLDKDLSSFIQSITKRDDIDFFHFTKKQILGAGIKDYLSSSKEIKAISLYVSKNIKNKKDTEHIIQTLYLAAISSVTMQSLFNYVSSFLNFESVEEVNQFASLYINLYNHSHQWEIKGHTPASLRLFLNKKH